MDTMTVSSSSFHHNGMIPPKYTADGQDISPHLKWSEGPAGTKSYAIICDDPDAPVGNWNHWILFNIPPEITELHEDFLVSRKPSPSMRAGTNDFRKLDYGGPAPPGGVHRYFFKVYALSEMLNLKEGARRSDLLQAMEGKTLGAGEIMGRYTRER
ncbi:MAG TPA: YbhB/YbcL family Raf kinase inhibitor-like protein [Spirochaetota bacterium]|nr:YbhB/YbcL family Raf kinase inhibitor-like protein [Spirochaetota bacterium]